MSITGFGHFNLRAGQPLLDELRQFYVDVVGLAPGPRPPLRSSGYWLYAGRQDVLHLSEARAGEVRPINALSTFDHVALTCDDLAAAEERLRRHGVRYSTASVPSTGLRQLFFSDPAGNGIELNGRDAG